MELFCTDQIVLMICGLEGNPSPPIVLTGAVTTMDC